MRILYLAPPRTNADRLTSFTFVDEEICALAKRGNEIHLLCEDSYGVSAQRGSVTGGIRLHKIPRGKSLRELVVTLIFLWRLRGSVPTQSWLYPLHLFRAARIERFLAEVSGENGIDLIHSNFGWPSGFGGLLVKAATGLPLISTFRGMDVLLAPEIDYGLRRSRAYDHALRTLLRNADFTTHVSDFIRLRALGIGAVEHRARTIHKGVDCDRFNGNDPVDHGLGDRPMILVVAGLVARKGVHHIIDALGRLKDSHDFSLVVIGSGAEREPLARQCERLSLLDRTLFTGQMSRELIPRWFAASDIFILGSILEASGNVLLEAMASGKAVICTNSGGPPEYVVDGETGFVVPVSDPSAMSEKVRLLLDDPVLRMRLGSRGCERARELLPYSRMIDAILMVYREALSR